MFNIFCRHFTHVSYLPMSTKRCFILFRSWVICKNQKRPGSYPLAFYIFINNSRSNQNWKIPNTFCRHCQVENVCKISAKYIKLCGSWRSSKSSIFQPGFSEIIELCLNLGLRFCITWLVLPNYKKITPKKPILI